ncbi:MAG: immune inhibitor A [Chloroflexi bacterium]|nr:immune inhibitor A [Chloroflexota bacterium]
MSRNSIIVVSIVGLLLCCCIVALCVGGFLVFQVVSVQGTLFAQIATEIAVTPLSISTPTPAPVIVTTPVPTPLPGAQDTLQTLEEELAPENNLRELTTRLLGVQDIPETVSDTPADHALGTELVFNASNADTHDNFTVTAELVYKTDNVYFFVQKGVDVDQGAVEKMVDNFQNETYPTDREFFGSEWNPGVDGDPRLYILFARGLGATTGGYYTSYDEYSRLAREESNEKEMFYINADGTFPGDPYLDSALAHEFQHMIHWYHDHNEESWINEGSSVLAEFLNGYGSTGVEFAYVNNPDLQLNTWTEGTAGENTAHYGAGFLFMAYFLDRFGEEATQALVADPANGLRSVEDVLTEQNLSDPLTGGPITMVDVFADWVIANYLGDPDVADGRYEYNNYPDSPTISAPTDSFFSCPVANTSATVRQFGADYYEINCDGQITLNFTGSQQVSVVPSEPHSGRYAFWGGRTDQSDTTLTREFDLTGLTSATLNYWALWTIEEDFDYAYVLASADNGETWEMLETPGGTDADPNLSNFGWGYTDNSGGGETPVWVEETVDLSKYAGKKITIRFEYVTDPNTNRAGFMVDDVSIPELNYSADFETDDGGWDGAGFVRIDNILPQNFVVQVIKQSGDSSETTVERLALDAANSGSLTLNLGKGEKAVLVVSGATQFTTEVASYQFEIK